MSAPDRSVLADVARAYINSYDRYSRSMRRGDFDRADDAMAEIQTIERCVSVKETSTAWRQGRKDVRS